MDQQPINPRHRVAPHRQERMHRRVQPISDFGQSRPVNAGSPSQTSQYRPHSPQPQTQQQLPSDNLNPLADIASPLFGASREAVQSQVPYQPTPSPTNPMPTAPNQIAEAPVEKTVAKKPIPFGVYIIIGLSFITILINFFRSSTYGDITSLLLIIQSILALLLLTRKNFARIGILIVSAIIIVVSVLLIGQTVLVRQKIKSMEIKYNQAVNQLNVDDLTDEQRRSLASSQAEISNLRHQAGRDVIIAVTGQVSAIALSGLSIWYVNRKKVKDAFSPR